MTRHDPDFLQAVRAEFSGFRHWIDRAIVLAYATAAGLAVVGFTILSEWAFDGFHKLQSWSPWWSLLWTPAISGGVVWATRRWFAGATGSGIPQVMAALDPAMTRDGAFRFVSLRLSLAKIALSAAGLLGGLSLGREGPSVQVGAGVMQHAGRWLRPDSGIDRRALLVAGGAAGIAAAFNAPLAGVVFAIEELSRKLESRSSGLIITAIVLAGLMGVSAFGNLTYFGRITVPHLGWDALLPGLAVSLSCGLLGGLFSRLLIASLTGPHAGPPERLNRWRARWPVRFAAACGLAVAVIGLASGGETFGAGSESVKHMMAGQTEVSPFYALLKFAATWLTTWSGVPGGIFAPSLSIGAGVGHDISLVVGRDIAPALIAMGMAAFLAAVTQAPLTAFIIVMEMVDGHAMVLSLMTAAMLASLVSRMLSRSLYATLSEAMVESVVGPKHAARDIPRESSAQEAPAQETPAKEAPAKETP